MLVSRWLDNYNSDANVSQAIFVRSKLLPPHIFSLVQREEEIKKKHQEELLRTIQML